MKRNFAFFLLLLIFCALTLANAQSTDATISGVVLDPSGKVIIDADIEILNEATGVHYASRTNGTGIYSVAILPPPVNTSSRCRRSASKRSSNRTSF